MTAPSSWTETFQAPAANNRCAARYRELHGLRHRPQITMRSKRAAPPIERYAGGLDMIQQFGESRAPAGRARRRCGQRHHLRVRRLVDASSIRAARGFSLRFSEVPLDMRMEQAGPSAADLGQCLGRAPARRSHLHLRRGAARRARIARAIIAARNSSADRDRPTAWPKSMRRAIGGEARTACRSIRRPAPSRRCASP